MMLLMAVRFRQGAGRLSLDFVRTLRWRGTPLAAEELPDGAALRAWIAQCAPCQPTGRAEQPGDAGVAEARQLREALHRLITTTMDGSPPSPADLDRLNAAAARPAPAPHLDPTGHLHHRADHPVAATLSLLARDALDLVSSPALARVRRCADPTCGALFHDGSRPGHRRWCSMDVCGNRAKKEALRSTAPTGRPVTNS
jgi:predicted RNA-binding Zn ribbon-like protein